MSEDRVMVVTGSSSGLGAAMIKEFAARGFGVCINYVIEEDAQAVYDEILEIADESKVMMYKADVAHREQVKAMFDAIIDKFGRVDILVNTAGINRDMPFTDMTDESWHAVISAHLHGHFVCSQEYVFHNPDREGVIINRCAEAMGFAYSAVEIEGELAHHDEVVERADTELSTVRSELGAAVDAGLVLDDGPLAAPLRLVHGLVRALEHLATMREVDARDLDLLGLDGHLSWSVTSFLVSSIVPTTAWRCGSPACRMRSVATGTSRRQTGNAGSKSTPDALAPHRPRRPKAPK